MPITDIPRTVPYLGTLTVPLTVAFTGLPNIVFAKQSPVPLASGGYWSGTAWQGTSGWVAGNANKNLPGISTFELGVQTGFDTGGNWCPSSYANGKLFGPYSGGAFEGISQNNEPVFGFEKAIPLNSGDTVAAFPNHTLFTFPATASRWPLLNTNGGFWGNPDGSSTIHTTYNGVYTVFKYDISGACSLLSNTSPLVWAAGQSMQACMGFNGTYYISSTGSGNWIIVTDFGTDAVRYALTFASPDGSFNMDAPLKNKQGLAAWMTSRMGWLVFNNSTVTIGGVVLNGYGVLILPDGSGYFLIQVLPQSIPAQDWNNPARGDPIGKVDEMNNLYIQTPNNGGTLYFGGVLGPQTTSVPQLPIINVPHNPGLFK